MPVHQEMKSPKKQLSDGWRSIALAIECTLLEERFAKPANSDGHDALKMNGLPKFRNVSTCSGIYKRKNCKHQSKSRTE